MREGLTGADDRDRTDDLSITNRMLYQLSYVGLPSIVNAVGMSVKLGALLSAALAKPGKQR